ncbi:MAG: ribosome silencing factor [Deltaproteobacteria bacterium]|nr:ribosome silencing factor [Deltaproteobacteria bacterium]
MFIHANLSPDTVNTVDKALCCAKTAIDKNAERTVILDLTKLSCFTDYFVICSGTSDRQIQAITNSVEETLINKKISPLAIEGYTDGRWVLLDYGDVVMHIFQDNLRDYYDLETLWTKATKIRIPVEFYRSSISTETLRL